MISKFILLTVFISTSALSQYIELKQKNNLDPKQVELARKEKMANEHKVHEDLINFYIQFKIYGNPIILRRCEINQQFGGPPASRELITLINTTYPARLKEISKCHHSKVGTEIGSREIGIVEKYGQNGAGNALIAMISNAPAVGVPKTRKDLDFCPEQEYSAKGMLLNYDNVYFSQKNWCDKF